MSKIETAKKKIQFAEYLLNRDDASDFSKGANKHLLDASKLAIRELLQFDNEEMEEKSLVIKRLFLNKYAYLLERPVV